MANENDYPNKWKDGWTQADHATESFSPYAVEKAKREALELEPRHERERNEEEYLANIRSDNAYSSMELSDEMIARQNASKRNEAVKLLVQQQREEYNKKSWFGKGISILRGKNFNKMKTQITDDAQKKVNKMNEEQLNNFIEEGKQR